MRSSEYGTPKWAPKGWVKAVDSPNWERIHHDDYLGEVTINFGDHYLSLRCETPDGNVMPVRWYVECAGQVESGFAPTVEEARKDALAEYYRLFEFWKPESKRHDKLKWQLKDAHKDVTVLLRMRKRLMEKMKEPREVTIRYKTNAWKVQK